MSGITVPSRQLDADAVHARHTDGVHPHPHGHHDDIDDIDDDDDDPRSKSEEADAEHEIDDLGDSNPRKKRRVTSNKAATKSGDKKFECPQPDCGKSYSRAEHLYRHQLNHTPKQIYYCDFPGCDRQFVRADLCGRHKERHTAKGSHLQRKDAFINSQRAAASAAANANNDSGETSPPVTATPSGDSTMRATQPPMSSRSADEYGQQSTMLQPLPQAQNAYQAHHMPDMMAPTPENAVHLDPQLSGNVSQYGGYPGQYGAATAIMSSTQSPSTGRRYSYGENIAGTPSVNGTYSHAPPMAVNGMQQQQQQQPPPLSSQQPPGGNMYAPPQYASPTSAGQQFRPSAAYGTMSVVHQPFGLPQDYGVVPNGPRGAGGGGVMSPSNMGANDQFQMPNSRLNAPGDFGIFDQYATGYAMPVFGHDYFNRSPPTAIDDNLFNQLLENNSLDLAVPSPPPPEPAQIPQYSDSPATKMDIDSKPSVERPPQQSLQIKGLNINIPESDVNSTKQSRLIVLLKNFEDIDGPSGRKMKDDLLSGDTADSNHSMSVHMLKTYITSYWVNIHQQMPILHRPTFNPETCPDLLLLAMVCLGACCLERRDMPEMIQKSADLAHFAAHHIRWEVFKDVEFRPTAKLWTFQTMLLLELYEKMYSTRTLHERAHIHHATTLTVMRRGSSLIGRSAVESPTNSNDPTRTPPGPDGSINTSGQNTPDAFWNRWITAEATRRVAFAAFVIDSTHATLFGHSAVMAPHDIRLPLPCDEALWSATSSAEVQRVEASLAANGFKPTSFLDGLKKTLNGQKVRTNTFGRVILMAGLLNVSWHMNQRDLQVSSLGASNTLGNPIRWRSPLTRAFDFWRRDFDESLSKNDHWLQVCSAKDSCSIDHRENVFESRTCLHSLAHMAMHVDIVDCEVFAGSDRALGRIVTDADRVVVQRRMREHWAPSARARDATFYALRFLCEVLIPDDDPHGGDEALKVPGSPDSRPAKPPASPKKPSAHPVFRYSARDDYLLNRPYILYFACMIVWSYGYALDGPLRAPSSAPHPLTSREAQTVDMQQYLVRMGSVTSPEDLEHVKNRNACLGLLLLLKDCFLQPRWELLHEASDLLGACVDLLVPGPPRSEKSASGGTEHSAAHSHQTESTGPYALS